MTDEKKTPLTVEELEAIRDRYNLLCDHQLAGLRIIGMGFTREDAKLVEVCGRYGGNEDWTLPDDRLDQLLLIAQKIAALLPPESPRELVRNEATEIVNQGLDDATNFPPPSE